VHGLVELDGGGQFGSRLLPHDRLRVEGAETQVTVGQVRFGSAWRAPNLLYRKET
jgi:hypothetical protein